MRRRAFLRVAGAAAVGSAAISTPAAASHRTHQPDHVTITYDEATLEAYKPLLVTRELTVRPNGIYGWLATSPEYEYDVCVYWTEYPYQRGYTDRDSHDGDHEPIYVYVSKDTGDVVRIRYSAYHWNVAEARGSAVPLADGTRPKMHVFSRWHHYRVTTEEGVDVDLFDLTSAFDDWLANGLEEALAPGVVVNPERMLNRTYWWAENPLGFSYAAWSTRFWYKFGARGAEGTDELE